ncbi:MAG: hypothetical protein F6K16_21625 [Symploca sp. SIO2B6]|nr:hypothetical protein [Symploca sp. SIO2B6]
MGRWGDSTLAPFPLVRRQMFRNLSDGTLLTFCILPLLKTLLCCSNCAVES